MREAPPVAEFAEVTLQIRQEGLQQTQAFLRMLHYAELALAVAKEAEEGEGRSRSWVTRMAERCQLVLRAGEDLERDRERWGTTKVLEFWFGHYTPAIQDASRRPTLPNEGQEAAAFHGVPSIQSVRSRTTAFHCVDRVQDCQGAFCRDSPPAGLHHPVQVRLGEKGGVPGVGRMDLRVARQIPRGAPSGGEAGSTVLGQRADPQQPGGNASLPRTQRPSDPLSSAPDARAAAGGRLLGQTVQSEADGGMAAAGQAVCSAGGLPGVGGGHAARLSHTPRASANGVLDLRSGRGSDQPIQCVDPGMRGWLPRVQPGPWSPRTSRRGSCPSLRSRRRREKQGVTLG
jgi:hypothetical protein